MSPVPTCHKRTCSSKRAASNWLSGEKIVFSTGPVWPSRVTCNTPVVEFRMLILSSDSKAKSWPSGDNAKLRPTAVPTGIWRSCKPVIASQKVIFVSHGAGAMRTGADAMRSLPADETARKSASRVSNSRMPHPAPVLTSQNLTVLLDAEPPDADTRTLLARKTMDLTYLPGWLKMPNWTPVWASHTLIPPPLTAASSLLPGENKRKSLTEGSLDKGIEKMAGSQSLLGAATRRNGGDYSPQNLCRTKLLAGAKNRAKKYVCNGASSIICRLYSTNRFPSAMYDFSHSAQSSVKQDHQLCTNYFGSKPYGRSLTQRSPSLTNISTALASFRSRLRASNQ